MPAYDIVAYAYKADLYCPDCIIYAATNAASFDALSALVDDPAYALGDIEAQLDLLAEQAGIDRQDEATYDSGDFPKVVFRDMLDGDEHCGHCHTKR